MTEPIKTKITKITDYKPDTENANAGTEYGGAMLEKSVRENGPGRSLLADKDGNIIAGNKTRQALIDSGIMEVIEITPEPGQVVVVKRDDLDLYSDQDQKARRMAYFDNRTSDVGLAWDPDQIIKDMNNDVELQGLFSDAELKQFENMVDSGERLEDPGAEDSKAEQLQKKWKVKTGDLWELGDHRIVCGDCTDSVVVERLMGGETMDAIVTDPPYGIEANKMTLGTGKKSFDRGENWDDERPDISFLIDKAEKMVIFGGNYFADILPVTNDWLCWHKKNDGLSFSEFELAWSNLGLGCRIIQHHWSGEEKTHPTQKPLPVMQWVVNMVDGVIADYYLGSGTTLIACERLSRQCRGVEIFPKYCSIVLERWHKMTGKTPKLLS